MDCQTTQSEPTALAYRSERTAEDEERTEKGISPASKLTGDRVLQENLYRGFPTDLPNSDILAKMPTSTRGFAGMEILENISCGLDAGTSSIGWGLIDTKAQQIVPLTVVEKLWRDGRVRRVEDQRFAAGVVKFDPVEKREQNKWTSRSRERGEFHRNRKRIQRKQWRLDEIVKLFNKAALIHTTDLEILFHTKGHKQERPSQLRERALREKLAGHDLFKALYNIAAHRVYEANSKAGDADEIASIGDNSEEKKPKQKKKGEKALAFGEHLIGLTNDIKASGLTPAEYFNLNFTKEDARLRGLEKRNDRLFMRSLLKDEVTRIFEAQRRFGNHQATVVLEEAFCHYAFYVKMGQDSEEFVGECSFARGEDGKPLKRAPKFAPSYERYRFLDKLSSLRLADGSFLSADQRKVALDQFGHRAVFSWAQLSDVLGIDPETGFKSTARDKSKDFAMGRGESARGTAALMDALSGIDVPISQLDLIARKLTHYADIRSIEGALRKEVESGVLSYVIVARIVEQARAGAFKFFKGTGNVSIEAAQKLSGHMRAGMNYPDACLACGWQHEEPENSPFAEIEKKRQETKLGADPKQVLSVINNEENLPVRAPGARKALVAAFKQFAAIVREFNGLPATVHVELGRDIGKSIEERTKDDLNRLDNESWNKKLATHYKEVVGQPPRHGSDDLLRFKLWQEQRHECPYRANRLDKGQGHISCEIFRQDRLGDGTLLNIDHILPRSWSNDNSYNNKLLCFAGENAQKGSDTPFQYFSRIAPNKWEQFKHWVDSLPELKSRAERKKGKNSAVAEPGVGGYKRRNLLVEDGEALEKLKQKVSRRQLNDTRFAAKVLAQAIQCLYPVEYHTDRDGKQREKRRVLARPGQLIGTVRHEWGMNRLKYDERGERKDERNHAVDALINAAITERMLQNLTETFQLREQQRERRPVPLPWPDFVTDVTNARDKVFVVRTERNRARGAIHKAGIFGGGPSTRHEVFTYKLNIKESFGIKDGKFDADEARKQLALMKDPERNTHIKKALEAWIEKDAPREDREWPIDQRGQVIRKITLIDQSRKPAIGVHDGDADRQNMIRVDVFLLDGAKRGAKWEFVPIYLYQILDKKCFPEAPSLTGLDKGVAAEFAFSLAKGDYVELVRNNSTIYVGYFGSFDISNSKIKLQHHAELKASKNEAAAKKMLTINKYAVDRFGRKSLVRNEVRTWHGEVCTSLSPPG